MCVHNCATGLRPEPGPERHPRWQCHPVTRWHRVPTPFFSGGGKLNCSAAAGGGSGAVLGNVII
jgi:hypothetical protein